MPTYMSLINITEQGIRNLKDAASLKEAAKQLLCDPGGEMKAN